MVRVLVSRMLIGLLAVVTLALPVWYYRYQYGELKRVRVVTEGKVYRSGQLTEAGFDQVIERFGIRTVINLQDEDANPRLSQQLREKEYCQRKGVNYIYLPPLLVAEGEPVTLEQFLAVFDDINHYPILIHCKAGLHRTGTLVAFYRLEYEGWTPQAAMHELVVHGFSPKQCHVKNPYIKNYLVDYIPRSKRWPTTVKGRVVPSL
ncbi:MAG TPA: dual specificity protein phosphatase family protein [Gemmatales bacterium]|nr:dual specificity protein phosphatase family protein [Gemmatales bacterium]HMP17520.1 dual specificity protein phosphatase family protein [Gemmatales bacterium]